MAEELLPQEGPNSGGHDSEMDLSGLGENSSGQGARLPVIIIDNIIARILDDPPFITLNRLCRVCRRFRQILFSKCYLVYVHSGKLKVFHSSTSRSWWETVSLQFCQDRLPGLNLDNLELVFSRAGFMFLSTGVDGEFIVCNPLTQRCGRVIMKAGRTGIGNVGSASDPVVTTWCISADDSNPIPHRQYSSRLVEAKVFHSRSLRRLRLMLHYSSQSAREEIRLYELHRDHERRLVAILPKNSGFLIPGQVLEWTNEKAVLYFGFVKRDGGGINYFVYDGNTRRCKDVKTEKGRRLELPRSGPEEQFIGRICSNGDEFLLSRVQRLGTPDRKQIQFQSLVCTYFIRNFSSSIGLAKSSATREKDLCTELIQFREDGVTCCVSILTSLLPGSPPRVTDYMSVWMHDVESRENLLSDWTEWAPGVLNDGQIVESFHILRPKFTYAGQCQS